MLWAWRTTPIASPLRRAAAVRPGNMTSWWALSSEPAAAAGYVAELLDAVEAVNDRQKHRVFEKISNYYDGELEGKTIAIWGLSFKPRTDDMREAPSRVLLEALWQAGARVQAFDPEAMNECQRIYGQRDDLLLVGTAEAAVKGADALVTVTEWHQFRAPDFELIKESLKSPVIFDGRNMYDPNRLRDKGFAYYSIGRA